MPLRFYYSMTERWWIKIEYFINKTKNMSIVWKFTIIFFALIMVPTIAFLIGNNKWTNDSIKLQSDRIMMQRILQLKNNILYTAKDTENIAKEIIFSNEVQAFLGNEFNFTSKELDYFIYKIQSKVMNIKHLYPSKYYKLRIFTSNYRMKEEYDIIYSVNRIKSNKYFKDMFKSDKEIIWGEIRKVEEYYDVNSSISAKIDKDIILPLYVPIRSIDNKKVIGVLEIDIQIEKIFGETWELRLEDDAYMSVFDKDGNIISSNKGNHLIGGLDYRKFTKENGNFLFKYGKKKYRVVYDTIEEMEYKVVAITPDKSINSKSVFLFTVIGILLAFFITFVTTKILFAKLKLLTELMKRVEEGEFDVRIDESSHDEIGELAHRFNRMAEKLKNTIINLIEKETVTRDAEIRALHSQINPHFLYNTLENIRMECEIRQEIDISEAIASLGRLFRYNIKWDGGLVTVQNEIDHVNNFITIMQLRFKSKIDYKDKISENLLKCFILKVTLQPLVENCFSHAFVDKEDKWEISIESYIEGEILYIVISDNGSGIEVGKLSKINDALQNNKSIELSVSSGSRIGLKNVNNRIKMQFGEEYGIRLESKINQGTRVIIKSPYYIRNFQTELL